MAAPNLETKTSVVAKLARFLRVNGDNVISGRSKLSLTTSVLSMINSVFVELLVYNNTSLTSNTLEGSVTTEFVEDAKFLLDFVKKTKFLKLFHEVQTLRGGVDISYFKNLRALELKKIPAHLIVGLNTLPHLRTLSCNRSLASLKELFGSYDNESRAEEVWLQVKELNVSSNYLESLDSIHSVPNVEIIDASQNNLKKLYELMLLDRLIVLKLNCNMLDAIPVLSHYSAYSLRVLLMKNNNVEDLTGLQFLVNLEELDVSFNCISEFHALKPVEALKFLKLFHIQNNPVAQGNHYRERIALFFHADIASRGIVVDGKRMSPKEIQLQISKKAVLNYGSQQQTSIIAIMEDKGNMGIYPPQHQPLRQLRCTPTYKGEKNTKYTLRIEEDDTSSIGSEDSSQQVVHRNDNVKLLQEANDIPPIAKKCDEKALDSNEIKGCNEEDVPSHIMTKRLIESRRKEYGAEWLIPSQSFRNLCLKDDNQVSSSCPASKISEYDIDVDIPKVPGISPSDETSSKGDSMKPEVGDLDTLPSDDSSPMNLNPRKPSVISDDIQVLEPSSYDQAYQSFVIKTEKFADSNVYEKANRNEHVDYKETSEGVVVVSDSEDGPYFRNSHSGSDSQCDDFDLLPFNSGCRKFTTNTKSEIIRTRVDNHSVCFMQNTAWCKKILQHLTGTCGVVVVSDSEDEIEDRIFLLDRVEESKQYPVFVCVGQNILKEKVFKTGRLSDVLDLTRLISVKINDIIIEDVAKWDVVLTMDAAQLSKQKRIYRCDEVHYAENLFSILKPYADAKALEDATVGALQCLKCRSQFSRQVAHLKVFHKRKADESTYLPSSYDSGKGDIEETVVCPNCGSNMVVELEVVPFPSIATSSVRQLRVSPKKSTQPSASPSLGHLSSMLYSMMQYTRTRKDTDLPVTSSPKRDTSATAEELVIEENTQYNTAVSHVSDHDVDENLIEGSDVGAVAAENTETASERLSRVSSTGTIQSQSSIIVISSDSENETASNVVHERATVYSNLCVSAASPTGGKSVVSSDENIILPSVSESTSGNGSDEVFHECKSRLENVTQPNDEGEKILQVLLEEKGKVTHFVEIDHRLKLFLDFVIFAKDEELDLCLEVDVIHPVKNTEYRGFLVFSSKYIYVMKLDGKICDDVSQAVQKMHTFSLQQLRCIQLFPGGQGFASLFTSDKVFYFIIQDSECCNLFLSCLKDTLVKRLPGSNIPPIEAFDTEGFQRVWKDIFGYFFGSTRSYHLEILLYLLVSWSDSEGQPKTQRVALVVTSSYLFTARVSFCKHFSRQQVLKEGLLLYDPLSFQRLTDVVEIQIKNSFKEATINFLDDKGKECFWRIYVQMSQPLYALVIALKKPWENLFGISLPLRLHE